MVVPIQGIFHMAIYLTSYTVDLAVWGRMYSTSYRHGRSSVNGGFFSSPTFNPSFPLSRHFSVVLHFCRLWVQRFLLHRVTPLVIYPIRLFLLVRF